MIIQQTGTDGTHAVHVKQPTRKAWAQALRSAAVKERLAPGVWLIQSSRHADVRYRVDLHADTCPCPAGSHGLDCWHKVEAQRRERLIEEAETRRKAAFLATQLRALKAEYQDGIFWLAVEEVELDAMSEVHA